MQKSHPSGYGSGCSDERKIRYESTYLSSEVNVAIDCCQQILHDVIAVMPEWKARISVLVCESCDLDDRPLQ